MDSAIQKVSLSELHFPISNNIAEGVVRGTTSELINFLYIARGSPGETRSMLRVCESVPRFSNFRSKISDLINRAIGISKQLHEWIDSLKDTSMRGVKFLAGKDRERRETDQKFAEFDREMNRFREELLEKLKRREIEAARDNEAKGDNM